MAGRLKQPFLWAVGLMFSDKEFMQQHAQQIEPRDFGDRGRLKDLVALALEEWNQHHRLLGPQAVAALLGALPQEQALAMWSLYEQLMQDYRATREARASIRDMAAEWLRGRWAFRAAEDAITLLEHGRVEDAAEKLLTVRQLKEDEDERITTLGGLPEMGERMDWVSRAPTAIPTGLPSGKGDLDDYIDGGLHPNDFGIVLASTNVGKSMCLAYLAAKAWLANKRVLYFTYELTPTQTSRRIAAAIMRRPITKLPRGKALMEELVAVQERKGLDKAFFDVRQDVETVPELVAAIRDMERAGIKPDLVILDSADDLRALGKTKNRYEAQGEVYMALRAEVARKLEVAIWTSTQATRDAVDKGLVSLRQVGDCFDKVRRAHIVLGLSQTKQELIEEDPSIVREPIMKLWVLKDSLHGARGKGCEMYVGFGQGSGGWPWFRLKPADPFGGGD